MYRGFFIQKLRCDYLLNSQKILNQIAKARLNLLNREKKTEYDKRLRAKIDKDFDAPLLHTVRGVGYSIRVERA